MGLLKEAEKRRELLDKLTKEKKKYVDHISKKRKKVIHEEIKKQRKIIKKVVEKKPKKPEEKKKKPLIKKVKKPKVKLAKKLPIKKAKPKVKKLKLKIKKKEIKPEILLPAKPPEIKEEISKPKIPSEIEKPTKATPETPFFEVPTTAPKKLKKPAKDFVFTGVTGFDDLLVQGIPQGTSTIIAGGAGSGKTIFCLQTLAYHASHGKKCIYMSFEEPESRLIKHMQSFGFNPKKLIKAGKLKIIRKNPFEITRNVDALLAEQKGELLIKVDPVIIPKGFKPDFIVIDSLTAIASAFTGKEESYRIYIEQLFRFFEKMKANALLITETEQIPKIFSKTGVEEFLADGVVVLYNIKRGNIRERAIEVLKLRGAEHQKRIVAFDITDKGITVYPNKEILDALE